MDPPVVASNGASPTTGVPVAASRGASPAEGVPVAASRGAAPTTGVPIAVSRGASPTDGVPVATSRGGAPAVAPLPTREFDVETSSSSSSSHLQPLIPGWLPKVGIDDILASIRKKQEYLPGLVSEIDEMEGETHREERPVDIRRAEIMNRLLELLTEQSPSSVGVLQSTIVSMFSKTGFYNSSAYFWTPAEINEGCATGPSNPLSLAMEHGVDDRLVVTIETFEYMVEQITNFELARLLDAYTDHVQAMEMAWQLSVLEKQVDGSHSADVPRIKNAAGVAVWGEHAYIADAEQCAIFRVNMITDEIQHFCGARGKKGMHDGPREMARFNNPGGLAICEATNTLYVCDTGNDVIRTVSITSGVVHTLPLNHTDSDTRLEAPVGICIVRGEYEYEKEEDEDEDDEEEENKTMNSENLQDFDEEDDEDAMGHHGPLLEGITEEEEDDYPVPSSQRSSFAGGWGDGGTAARASAQRTSVNARYTLATDPAPGKALGRNLFVPNPMKPGVAHLPVSAATRRRISMDTVGTGGGNSRRTSGFLSAHTSRRTSTYLSSVSSLSSRRTSHFSVTPGESAKDSLRECTEEEEEVGYNLAVTGDHCVYLIKPEKGDRPRDLIVLAGSHSEYGYKDAEKGSDARFSSLKGVTCIRCSLFVADHWNNVIRCVNLKTRQVDTVIDFQPCGPLALTVSSSGSVFVLDSEHISVCNILKICSLQCSTKDADGALGTTMFQMIQESIRGTRDKSDSRRNSNDSGFLESLSRRGSYRGGDPRRRDSLDSDVSDQRRASQRSASDAGFSHRGSRAEDMMLSVSRRNSNVSVNDKAGCISNLGPSNLRPGDQPDRSGGSPLPNALVGMRTPTRSADPQRISMNIPSNSNVASRMASPRVSDAGALGAHTPGGGSLPVVPRALRSLVPGASLHPALVQMTLRPRDNPHHSIHTALTGSQFHVSVVSSVHEDEFEEGPEFFSFLNPKHETPWKKIPIGSLQYVYQEATGQFSANAPLTLAYWDAADSDATAHNPAVRNAQQILVGGAEWPAVLKVLPPRKAAPQENGRFRAVAVDVDRVVMADSDSNSIFVVNHLKHTKDKIAGCGKAGYLDGPLDVCRMNQPSSIALDPNTHYIYVADSGNHRIRRVDLSTGFMRTVCGNGMKGNHDGSDLAAQSLDSPFDLHFMHPCHLLICCADNSIRRLDLKSGQLETVLVGS